MALSILLDKGVLNKLNAKEREYRWNKRVNKTIKLPWIKMQMMFKFFAITI